MDLWTIEDLLRIKIPSDISIAPDQKQLAYIVRIFDEEKDQYLRKVFRQSTDGQEKPEQLTQGSFNDSRPKYSSDGKWLAFLSERPVKDDDDDDDEEQTRRLYLLPLNGGEAKCITADLASIYDYDFAPDGKSLYVITDAEQREFEKERKKALEDHKRDYTHEERSLVPRRICRIEIESETISTIYRRDYGLMELTASPNGNGLVFSTNHTGVTNDFDTTNLFVLEPAVKAQIGNHEASHEWVVRPLVERTGACHTPRVSPDGSYVAYIAPRFELSEHSQSEVWIVPFDTSKGSANDKRVNDKSVNDQPVNAQSVKDKPVNVTEKLGFVGDAMAVEWLSNSEILFQAEQGLYSRFFSVQDVQAVLSDEAGTVTAGTVADVISGPTEVDSFAVHPSGQMVAYIAQTSNQPPEVFVWQQDSQERGGSKHSEQSVRDSGGHTGTRQVSQWHEEWQHKYRAVVQDYHWQADDGTEMEGVLVLPSEGPNPETGSNGKWPLIVDIHGGPAWHTTKGFLQYLNFHWLCQLGYAVFLPNYRGGLAYGQDYLYANHHDLGGIDYRDIISGVDALIEAGTVDENRMGVTGGSYGGYMTNWIIGHDHRFKAAVSEFGIWNLMTDFGCSSQRCWEVMYLDRYWENEALYLERSPARYVAEVTTPTLIIHGDDDDNTFISNSKEMYNGLLEAGKQVEFVHYPREGHGLREPRHKADELQKIASWFGHFIPTDRTDKPVKAQEWVSITDHLRARVMGAQVVMDYKGVGEDFSKLLRVEVELEPMESTQKSANKVEPTAGAPQSTSRPDGTRTVEGDGGAKKESVVVVGDAEENTVVLKWTGTEKYQRASVLGAKEIGAVGLALPQAGLLLTGKQTLHVLEPSKLSFLFPSDWMEYGQLSETVLQIKDKRFQL